MQLLARWDVTVVWCLYIKQDTFYFCIYFNGILFCDLVSTHETYIISLSCILAVGPLYGLFSLTLYMVLTFEFACIDLSAHVQGLLNPS